MEKLLFSLPKKVILLAFLSFFIFQHNSFSQCVIANPVQEFCASEHKTVADLEVTTGINVVWFDALNGGNQYEPSDPIVDGNSYYALDIDPSCTDPTRIEVTVIIYGEPPTNVDVFVGKCASEQSTINDLSADGIDIKWFDAQTGGTELPTSTELQDGQTYWVQQTENGCTSERLPTTVSLIDPATPTIQNVQSFCSTQNATVADLEANESNIVWYSSENSTTPLNTLTPLINGEDYWASQIIFPCESTVRMQTTVVIDTVSDAGTEGSYSECELNLTTTNLFSLLGGTPDNTGVWSGPSTLSGDYLGTFDPGVNTEGTYTYTVASSLGVCPDATSNVEVIILKVVPPTTSSTTQTFCEIDDPTVGSLLAAGVNIQWYDTDTSTTPLNLSDALINGEDYYATQTEANGCESTSRLKVTASIITPLPPTTSNATQTFCEIDNPTIASLNAVGTTIQWYDTETTTTPLNLTDTIIDGEDYWATQTEASGCESVSRLVITASVIAPLPPTASQTNQTFCEIDNPTVASLNAVGTTIQWYDTETSTTPLNLTDTIIDGEDYWATQTEVDGCESKTRLQVTATIETPLAPTISEANQTFCEIDNPTIASLNASGTSIQWYATETSTTVLNTTDILVEQTYWASQTDASGCESATRSIVTVTITAPLAPITSEATQTFCEIDNPTIASLNAIGTTIQWYATETSTTPLNLTDTLIDGEDYWATQTEASGCESTARLVVNAVVLAPLAPTTTNTIQTFCEIDAATVADLNATGSGILWYASETSTTALDSTELLIDGEDYWATQTDAIGCESALRLVVNVNIVVELPPTTSETTQTFCEIENATISDLSVVGNNIQWYDSETSTTPLDTSEVLVNGEDYWATQNAASNCESALRLVVTTTIISTPPPTTSATNQSFCMNDFAPDSPTIADLAISGDGIQWYATETSTTVLNTTDILVDGQTYWASQTDASGCESATRISITATVTNTPIATTSNASQTFCAANNPTIADIDVTGDTIIWFDTETSTTPLSTSETLVDGEDYWALNTNGTTGCESSDRLQITSTIIEVPAPIIENTTQSFCEVSNPTIADLVSQDTVEWFTSETATTPLTTSDLLTNNTVYWASAVNAIGCNSSVKIAVTVILNNPGTPVLDNLGDEFCKINNPTLDDLNNRVTPVNNGTIIWYADYPNGTPLSLSEYLIDSETYYAVETDSNGCESVTPLDVTVDLEACDEYDIVTYDGFSPNGDGVNDTFKIENLRVLYTDFKVEFFNRWGTKVYTADANREDWNGRLKGNGEYVTSGVYYFVIYFNKDNRKPLQDRLYLSR
ncbi:gliding motility-associated C-terminal domain-containing protein [Lutibacter agarilyticus]|uniref:Gliding motility-associated C-terminal domain-containing protein n=1 Tax=Lutibacter agarilyticus TaxID=1109740 RepID=A0A238WHZ6_9FLAO|nr:gliding motility-associated C-terminal domain-containing protein [Lutibacter agarilyticus]SNR45874.1 gliding motility-associated C-terminal domain-containing protein [Lutibacter agarilyticus]